MNISTNSSHTKLISHQQSAHQAGFSLLEVLVTVFVLSIGLLGIAGMQATSLKLSHESHLRSQASLLTADIGDRMRSNTTISRAGGYDGTYTSLDNPDTGCLGNGICAPTRISTLDLNNWRYNLGLTFPGVQATINTVTVQGQTIATITLIWVDTDNDDGVNAANANDRRFTLNTVI